MINSGNLEVSLRELVAGIQDCCGDELRGALHDSKMCESTMHNAATNSSLTLIASVSGGL